MQQILQMFEKLFDRLESKFCTLLEPTQLTFTGSNSTIETQEKSVKYVQS